jgi:SAM-dependent methyltransferase
MTSPVRLADAYALRTPADNRNLYARWASTYDTEFVEAQGYVYPAHIAELLTSVCERGEYRELVPGPGPKAAILDVGCGTGLVGAALTAHGAPWIIDGIDISAQMLAQAAAKSRPDGTPLYRNLIEADLTRELAAEGTAKVEIALGAYCAVVSAGTFTHGHLGPGALSALVPFGRAGALFVIGINAEHYAARGFGECLEAEVAAGTIVGLESHVVEVYRPESEHAGATAIVAVFRRSG